MNNRIGLHLRYQQSPLEAIQEALVLQIPFFQLFLIDGKIGKIAYMSDDDIQQFNEKRKHIVDFFVHSSYLINLAGLGKFGRALLKEELILSEKLGASAIVFHLGSAKERMTRYDKMKNIVEMLQFVLETTKLSVILENTAHKTGSIGSDILDIGEIFDRMYQYYERLFFCLDTAHAYSFGYNFFDAHNQDLFIKFLENTIGYGRIKLIHLNDSYAEFSSYIDWHAPFGKGNIGKHCLKRLIVKKELAHVPLLLELSETEMVHVDHIIKLILSV